MTPRTPGPEWANVAGELRVCLRSGSVLTEVDMMAGYLGDEASLAPPGRALAVVLPSDTSEVAAVLRWASANRVPVVPRGAGTGLSGGATAVEGCVVLSTAKLNRILALDQADQVAVVEPGVVTADLAQAAKNLGLTYAPDPSSHQMCTIGGNVATNAGGLRCVKYGVTRDAVLSLEVVLAGGRVIRTGRPVRKDVAGYDLTSLFVGSEGTLGVITCATVKLVPLPAGPGATVVSMFPSLRAAGRAVALMIRTGITPSLLELLDREVLACIEEWHPLGIDASVAALLLAQSDAGNTAGEAVAIAGCCRQAGASEVIEAADHAEAELLLTARRLAYPALSRHGATLIEDICVPRDKLPQMLVQVQRISDERAVRIGTVAHAGDGNLHPTIIFDPGDDASRQAAYAAAEAIYEAALGFGGTITGEHGVGVLKRDWLARQLGSGSLDVHRAIKKALDPMNILNPGKVFL